MKARFRVGVGGGSGTVQATHQLRRRDPTYKNCNFGNRSSDTAKKLSLRSGVRTNIRRLRSRTRLINLRFKISRFRNQDGSKLAVCGFLGKLEKRRYLINEIIPA